MIRTLPFVNSFTVAVAAAAMLLFSACTEDTLVNNTYSGPNLRFEVVDAHGWQTTPQSRAAADMTDAPKHTGVLTLQGETPADTLFLHAMVTDGIEPGRPDTVSGRPDTETPQTRAMPVDKETFYDSFGVLASVYTGDWDETSCQPDYMYNVKVTKESKWATNYYWPGGKQKVKFFAYAPYNGDGIILSDKAKPGVPAITYTVPAEVTAQKDLLVASPEEMEGNASTIVTLPFKHALTAVRFVTGEDMMAGSIKKITLKGVYGSGTHAIGSDSWGEYGETTADFSQEFPDGMAVDGKPGQEITPVEATFMMLPQTLPEGATIEVVYTDDLTSIERTLTAPIAGNEWPIGKTVTYRISTKSILVEPRFMITNYFPYDYDGGEGFYSVRSWLIVSRPGDETKKFPLKWTAEFVEEDGKGGYRVIPQPDWIEGFVASGEGVIDKEVHYDVMVKSQVGFVKTPHYERLQAASLRGSAATPYDLSTEGGTASMNTANCYVINAPGTYSLPLVYGNAIKNGEDNPSAYTSQASGTDVLETFVNHLDAPITNPYIYENTGCTPQDAVLVWLDRVELVENVRLSDDKKSLTFNVPQENIQQGNAVVAVRDANGKIMWSWHIWVTDYVPGETTVDYYDPDKQPYDKVVTNFQGEKYTVMPVSLGWCDAGTMTYDDRVAMVRFTQETGETMVISTMFTQFGKSRESKRKQLTYQFGRKDPMIDNGCISDSYESEFIYEQATIGTSIQNPHAYYINHGKDWCSTTYDNLWNANYTVTPNGNQMVKTIYDPSPVGYYLPSSNVFTGFTFNGESVFYDSPSGSKLNLYKCTSDDFELYCNKMTGEGGYDDSAGTIFLPIAEYWYANPFDAEDAYFLDLSISSYSGKYSIGLNEKNERYRGRPVRPVREK